ncbi:MAG TPA: extracellular solute-binding protein [Phototrophicaceae bacterium]|nr:extracellular solute-binding protein [Phototrophicaceae bacterium]
MKTLPNIFAYSYITFVLLVFITCPNAFADPGANRQQVTITAVLDDQGDPPRLLKSLFEPALQELQSRHPNLDIKLDYNPLPYLELHNQFLESMSNKTSIDIMTVDQIWLGEFVQKGFLTDLTDYTPSWGRQDEWYEENWDGGVFNDRVYGIWTVADVRGMWYWKDLLEEAKVDPNSLETWQGYLEAAKKLNEILRPKGIEGVHLVGAGHSPDIEFYPYLWMQGGEIIKLKDGHPSKGVYWFPAFNGTEGIKALEFIKSQIDVGIKPQQQHHWGKEFLDRDFAVMIEALQNHVHLNNTDQKMDFEQKIGFFPFAPVPDRNQTSSTLMGGWLLGIPSTSKNPDLAWELMTIILDPKIMTPFHVQYGLLPTQIPIGNGPYSEELSKTIPYYEELISMLNIAQARPNIPEYPQIAETIQIALESVYNGTKLPTEALNEAAVSSAHILGW